MPWAIVCRAVSPWENGTSGAGGRWSADFQIGPGRFGDRRSGIRVCQRPSAVRRGRVCFNRPSDGAKVGVFDPGETVGGNKNTGWMDVMTGITAHRRQDGEYLVFVEEDYKAV